MLHLAEKIVPLVSTRAPAASPSSRPTVGPLRPTAGPSEALQRIEALDDMGMQVSLAKMLGPLVSVPFLLGLFR